MTRFLSARALIISISTLALGCGPALCAGDIIFGARFYIAPRQSKSNSASHFHLYRIDASGKNRRQITRGAHDDRAPMWAPDGSRVVFNRDDRFVTVANADGSDVRNLFDKGTRYGGLAQWTPDGREVVFLDQDSSTLFFLNARSGQKRVLKGVDEYAYSPDGKRLAWLGAGKKLCVLDLKTRSRTYTSLDAKRLAWAGPQVLVAALQAPNEEYQLSTFVTLDVAPQNTQAREIKRFSIHTSFDHKSVTTANGTSTYAKSVDGADWRSELLATPGTSQSFTFRSDDSTSSGRNGFYFRGNAQDGVLKPLAEGQSFCWAPDAKRFAWAPYYELASYNTPGQRPRVVYTSPLKIHDGSSTRTLVSGLVLIQGCDWR